MNTPDTRTSDYVCFDCGRPYQRPNAEERAVTCHISKCGLCEEEKSVTHIRHFNWLIKPKKQ